jgi:tRNA G10  N-methylase Trm11
MFSDRVFKNHLKNIKEAKYADRFGNLKDFLASKENILKSKEENYQAGFLNDIFVKVLGYTLFPRPNWNLTTEFKNISDSKKVDGAVLKDRNPIAVVELKSVKTKIEKIKEQAFSYKDNHPTCRYVITSNFEKIRLYIDHSNEWIEFDLFNLDLEEFKKFYLLLSKESLFADLPQIMKSEEKKRRENIATDFYKNYSDIRLELFYKIFEENEVSKEVSLSSAQKILDRFIFLFFAEDRYLLNPKISKEIIEKWNRDWESRELWHFVKLAFQGIDSGNVRMEIPAYSGGLFREDRNLDALKISDGVLEKALLLSEYDYQSELDVNILGHIFENSLDDLEKIRENLFGDEFEISRAIRKKDGIFYTPKYIVKYIVENSVGKICREKRKELDVFEYRKFLENLKILDPAVGSGAFLNGVFDFLIEEYRYVHREISKTSKDLLDLENLDTLILENNLFGIDINVEAVEITKLSLWLKTAKRGRKLTDLSESIKVGNSLVDEVFPNQKFDVILGNPPYIRIQGLKDKELETERFRSATGNYDIYVLFMERALEMISENGKASFILPHKFLISEFGKGIREVLLEKRGLESLVHFGSETVFKDASTYTCIVTLSEGNEKIEFTETEPSKLEELEFSSTPYENLSSEKWILKDDKTSKILEKLQKQKLRAGDVFEKIFQGIATSGDKIYLLEKRKNGLYSNSLKRDVEIENGLLKPILKGEDISRYGDLENRYFVIFPYLIENGKATPMSEKYISENFPNGYKYLKENEKELRNRERGKMNRDGWFLYIYPKSLTEFEQEKIVSPDIIHKMQLSLDTKDLIVKNGGYGIKIRKEFKKFQNELLALLNSSLMWFFLKNTGTELRGGYFRFNTKYIEPFPIPDLNKLSKSGISKKAKKLLELNSKLKLEKNSFLDEVREDYELSKLSKKLQNFETLSLSDFIKEIAKAKKWKLSKKMEKYLKNHWKTFFEESKEEILKTLKEIHKLETEIDEKVYQLYNLTPEEIKEI